MRRLAAFSMRPALAVFAAAFASMLLYSLTRTKIYESRAALEIVHHRGYGDIARGLLDFRSAGPGNLDRFGPIMTDERVMERVSATLSADDLHRLLRPFVTASREPDLNLARQILRRHFRVDFLRLSQLVVLVYRHPDPEIAARVANLFLEELVKIQNEMDAPRLKEVEAELVRRIESQRPAAEASASLFLPESRSRPADSQTASNSLIGSPDELTRLEAALRRVRAGYGGIAFIERARPPLVSDYVEPNHLRHIGIGAAMGLLAAVLAALFCGSPPTSGSARRGHDAACRKNASR